MEPEPSWLGGIRISTCDGVQVLLLRILLLKIDTQMPDIVEDASNDNGNQGETEEVVLEFRGDLI